MLFQRTKYQQKFLDKFCLRASRVPHNMVIHKLFLRVNLYDWWRYIFCKCLINRSLLLLSYCQSPVTNFKVLSLGGRFLIYINKFTHVVHILDSRYNLPKEPRSLTLIKSFFLDNVLEKFPFTDMLHNQEQFLRSFNNFVQLDNIGMVHQFQYIYFSGHSLYIGDILYFEFL